MRKAEKAALLNAVIGERWNGYAQNVGAEAYLTEDGKLRYRDRLPGYARQISLRELLAHLVGEDIRRIRRALAEG